MDLIGMKIRFGLLQYAGFVCFIVVFCQYNIVTTIDGRTRWITFMFLNVFLVPTIFCINFQLPKHKKSIIYLQFRTCRVQSFLGNNLLFTLLKYYCLKILIEVPIVVFLKLIMLYWVSRNQILFQRTSNFFIFIFPLCNFARNLSPV